MYLKEINTITRFGIVSSINTYFSNHKKDFFFFSFLRFFNSSSSLDNKYSKCNTKHNSLIKIIVILKFHSNMNQIGPVFITGFETVSIPTSITLSAN